MKSTTAGLKSAVSIFAKHDLLYGRLRPYLNKVLMADFAGAASAEFIVLPPSDAAEQSFVQRVLMSPQFVAFTGLRSTGDRPRISFERIADYQIELPPLLEQRRIVAKIDSLTGKSRRAREHLDHIPRLVEKYRQAVLAAAFSGVMSSDRRVVSQSHLAGPSSVAELDLDDSERGEWSTGELPASWEWRGFRATFRDITDGKRKLPQKRYLGEGRLSVVDKGAQTIGGYTNNEELRHPADPPFIVFGDHTRCVKFIDQPFVQGADGVKVLHSVEDVLPRYAYMALQAVVLPNKGYSRHMKFLKATVFPIAPLEEQAEIVRRIEAAFAAIDRLADEATSARKLVDRLDQSVLAKAFRGELVPQDPNDEPASALLERIRAERAATPKAKRGRKLQKA